MLKHIRGCYNKPENGQGFRIDLGGSSYRLGVWCFGELPLRCFANSPPFGQAILHQMPRADGHTKFFLLAPAL
jgi:hypothetical protein